MPPRVRRSHPLVHHCLPRRQQRHTSDVGEDRTDRDGDGAAQSDPCIIDGKRQPAYA